MPQQTYRVGVIGRTGRGDYGHDLDLAWKEVPRTQVVAVADDSKDGLAAEARKLGVDAAFSDYRRMMDEIKPDIVAVCPRWVDQHRDMCVAAAERGIHIYMEKPFCRTLEEADEIVAACERTHARLAINHPTRYSPRMETVQQILADGKIGEVVEWRARGKEDRRGGAEDLWVLGTHMLDAIHALAGQPLWCSASVTQKGEPIAKADVVEGNEGIGPLAGDRVHAMYGLPGGSVGYFSSRQAAAGRPSRYGLMILGSKGAIELLEGTMGSVKYTDDSSWGSPRGKGKWQDVTSAGIGRPEPLTEKKYTDRHTLAILDLLDAIENHRDPVSNAYTARAAVEMILAVFESQRLGRRVELPLENRKHPLTLLGS